MEIGHVEHEAQVSVKQAFLFAEQRKMQIARGATVLRNAPTRTAVDFCRYFLFRESTQVSRKFENLSIVFSIILF